MSQFSPEQEAELRKIWEEQHKNATSNPAAPTNAQEADYAGTRRLLRVLLLLVGEREDLPVAAGADVDEKIEDIPELLHTFYLPPSIFSVDDPGGTPIDIIFSGSGASQAGPPNFLAGIHAALYKRRKAGAGASVQQELWLHLSNNTSIDAVLAYKIYRIRGLT